MCKQSRKAANFHISAKKKKVREEREREREGDGRGRKREHGFLGEEASDDPSQANTVMRAGLRRKERRQRPIRGKSA